MLRFWKNIVIGALISAVFLALLAIPGLVCACWWGWGVVAPASFAFWGVCCALSIFIVLFAVIGQEVSDAIRRR